MRTIKFRGKSLDGKWLFGYIYRYVNRDGIDTVAIIEIENNGFYETLNLHKISHNTVGQFTGLRDSIGREIYEGDIVYSEFEDGSNGSSLVGWNEKQSCFGVMDEYAYRSKLEGFEYPEFQNHVMLAFMRDAKLFKVIGNIHDNPELLQHN